MHGLKLNCEYLLPWNLKYSIKLFDAGWWKQAYVGNTSIFAPEEEHSCFSSSPVFLPRTIDARRPAAHVLQNLDSYQTEK